MRLGKEEEVGVTRGKVTVIHRGHGEAPELLNKHRCGSVCFIHNIQGALAAVQE